MDADTCNKKGGEWLGNMCVAEVKINWNEGYLNSPQVKVVVDKYEHQDYVYGKKKVDNGFLYLAVNKHGLADFNFGDPKKPSRGYGGRTFTFKLKDGTTDTVIGPWSSRSGVMNQHFPEQVTEITIAEGEHGLYSGAMEINKLKKLLTKFKPDIELRKRERFEEKEIYYTPAVKGKPGKWEAKKKEYLPIKGEE